MPRTIVDGEIRVTFNSTLGDKDSPSAAQVEGDLNVTPYLRSIDTPLEGEAVDASDISTAFNVTAVLVAAPMMTTQTVLMMVLPSMVVGGLVFLALGVKYGEYRARR